MKVLTNVRFYRVAGIAQTLQSVFDFAATTSKPIRFVGVDVDATQNAAYDFAIPSHWKKIFRLVQPKVKYPTLRDVLVTANSLNDFRHAFLPIISAYSRIIRQEKPDLILINGTYFLPWCMHEAARETGIPTVLHYHGVLTKETQHWDKKPHSIMRAMEQSFDTGKLTYIFPSKLTQQTVEQEVFGHEIHRHAVLPNAIPDVFFARKPRQQRRGIGVVARWSWVKNPAFVVRLAKHMQKHRVDMPVTMVTDLPRYSSIRQRIGHSVTFRRPMLNHQMPIFYRSKSLVLSPSHYETFGNVAQEAVACGTPALVTPTMGIAETFRKLGLDHWVIDCCSPRQVMRRAKAVAGEPVREDVRTALRDMHGALHVHKSYFELLQQFAERT